MTLSMLLLTLLLTPKTPPPFSDVEAVATTPFLTITLESESPRVRVQRVPLSQTLPDVHTPIPHPEKHRMVLDLGPGFLLLLILLLIFLFHRPPLKE